MGLKKYQLVLVFSFSFVLIIIILDASVPGGGLIGKENRTTIFTILIIIIISMIGLSQLIYKIKKRSKNKTSNSSENDINIEIDNRIEETDIIDVEHVYQYTLDARPQETLQSTQVKDKEIATENLNEELEKTESEVDVEEQKFICVVHKGHIVGANVYICPKCKAFYCIKCVTALKKKKERCWICDRHFEL